MRAFVLTGSAGVQEQAATPAHQDDGREREDDVRRRLAARVAAHGHHLQQDGFVCLDRTVPTIIYMYMYMHTSLDVVCLQPSPTTTSTRSSAS